jgi:FAD synthetase
MNTATGFAEPLVTDTPLPFDELCAKIHSRIATFLAAEHVSARLESVQRQTRDALSVIEEALARYRWVLAASGFHFPRQWMLTVGEACQNSR